MTSFPSAPEEALSLPVIVIIIERGTGPGAGVAGQENTLEQLVIVTSELVILRFAEPEAI